MVCLYRDSGNPTGRVGLQRQVLRDTADHLGRNSMLLNSSLGQSVGFLIPHSVKRRQFGAVSKFGNANCVIISVGWHHTTQSAVELANASKNRR